MTTIYGQEIEVKVGSVIKPDNWRFTQRLEESTWPEAQFVLPTGYDFGITHLSVNVIVTGRTFQRREGEYWVRVQIEFVGDGEPSTLHGGWLLRN